MIVVTFDPANDRHRTAPWHVEQPERLLAVQEGLQQVEAGLVLLAEPAPRASLLAVHDAQYLDRLQSMCAAGGGELDPDTIVSRGSWDTALLAAGAGIVGASALIEGQDRTAFVAVRPPGHHAGRAKAAGFCLLNNVAVTATFLAERGERVAIVDWDVHHGDGTQEIFWDDPRVLYVSIHQWPLYPWTGRATEHGGLAARGLTLNVPLSPGSGGDQYVRAFDQLVTPVLDRFSPAWILVSAGFDAHRDDPLAAMALSADDFGRLTGRIMLAAGRRGKVMLFLEGGYDLDALRACAVSCAKGLNC